MATQIQAPSRSPRAPFRRRPPPIWQLVVVAVICMASATGVLLVAATPTGTPIADVGWSILVGVAIPLAASRARRWSLLALAALTALGSGGPRDLLISTGALALALALAVFDRRHRVAGAVIGAICIQVLVRLPDLGFQGAATLVAVAAVTPVVISGVRNTRRRIRRPIIITTAALAGLAVVLTVAVGVAALASQGNVERGIDLALAGIDAAAAGDDRQAIQQLRAAATELDRAASLLGSPLWAPSRAIPIVAQHQRALAIGTGTAHDLAVVASDAADAVALDALRPVDGRIDLDAVRSVEAPLSAAVVTLQAALSDLASTHSPWLAAPLTSRLGELSDEVATVLPDAHTALSAARVAPAMLGGDETRRWLVLFSTPAETRLLGGFISTWAVIEADDGAITLTHTGRVGDVNNGPGSDTRDIDAPPDYLDRYARYDPNTWFQNTSASPHFPSSAQVAASFYAQSMHEDIHGVIVIDPIALGGLADLVGGVDDLPIVGGPYDGDGLAQLILIDSHEQTRDEQDLIYGAAIQQVFSALTTGALPGPSGLADAMGVHVRERRLLMWTGEPAEQALLADLGLDGSLPPADDHDMVFVGMANNNPSKIDVYIERDISYHADYDPDTGEVVARASVTFTNTAPSNVADVVLGNAAGLPRGTARTYVTLFTPLSLDEVTVNGQVVGVTAHPEVGYQTYSSLVDIPPSGELTISWDLRGTLATGGYRLRYVPQPMVRPAALSLSATTTSRSWASTVGGPDGLVIDGARASLTATVTERIDLALALAAVAS